MNTVHPEFCVTLWGVELWSSLIQSITPYVAYSEGLKSVNNRRGATNGAMIFTYQGIQKPTNVNQRGDDNIRHDININRVNIRRDGL